MVSARPSAYKLASIGLVACSMLMHEILLTRICALRLYFHFAFLVISNCLLGLGASGALLTRFQGTFRRDERKWLAVFGSAYFVSLVGTYIALLRFTFPATLVLSDPSNLLTLSAFNLTGALPFVFGGVVVGMLLTFNVEHAHQLYAVDLAGAAMGCIACPLLLPRVGAGGVFISICLLALCGCVVLWHERWGGRVLAAGAVLGALGLYLLPTLDQRFPVPSKGFVDLARKVENERKLGAPYSVWTSNSRIDLVRVPREYSAGIFMRGTNVADLPPLPEMAGIAQDAFAGTSLVDFSEHPKAVSILRRSMYCAAYRLKSYPKVLVIGLGGGNDVWAAFANGVSSVKAVELNWPIVEIHRGMMRRYSRLLVESKSTQLIVGEGRSMLMRDRDQYDVIQMTGIDTWTALASGAYVLAENYLYTQQAIASMYQRLRPGGILQISRFSATMEALRLLSNMHAALQSQHVGDMEHSVSVLATVDSMMAVQLKKGSFTPEEQASTERYAKEAGIAVLYLPGRATPGLVDDFIRSPDKAGMIDRFPMNIAPTDDDRPYFFNYTKWQHPIDSMRSLGDIPSVSQGNPFFILSQLLISIVLSVLLIVAPTVGVSGLPARGAGGYLWFFSGLGLGFIFIEVAVIQKLTLFLGQPVYSLTVTLFSLLVFTGMGSLIFGGRLARDDKRIWWVPALVALYLVLFCQLSPLLVTKLIDLPIASRIALTVGMLAPLGCLLGVPFSHGLRVMAQARPELSPWAWAINGCLSVVGSVLTVIVSMNFGFRVVLWAAAVAYLLAFKALAHANRKNPVPD